MAERAVLYFCCCGFTMTLIQTINKIKPYSLDIFLCRSSGLKHYLILKPVVPLSDADTVHKWKEWATAWVYANFEGLGKISPEDAAVLNYRSTKEEFKSCYSLPEADVNKLASQAGECVECKTEETRSHDE